MCQVTGYQNNELQEILQIGIALSQAKDRSRLYEMIVDAGMHITHCDAGTLYVKKGSYLHFQAMKNLSLEADLGKRHKFELPPVPLKESNICAYSLLKRMPLNIADVYRNDRFDFQGPKQYDRLTGYHTVSMLTVPLLDQRCEAVGVLQLINAMDEEGHVCPFPKRMEPIILALSSQAAITIANARFIEEITLQMRSFTEAMAEAIDMRTPYNANHMRNVAKYVCALARHINQLYAQGKEEHYFDENHLERLELCALLHDIGKVAIPSSVMNKKTRLEGHLEQIQNRFRMFALGYENQYLKGQLSRECYEENCERLRTAQKMAEQVNKMGCLTTEVLAVIRPMLGWYYESTEGREPYFTQEEQECLQIKTGTLTEKERQTMESHVLLTDRLLSKVHFNSQYKGIRLWAAQHHEFLNGSGYPHHLTEKDLPLESRMLAVADICDALLATDRPYKQPMHREKAIQIMEEMAQEGKLDKKIVSYMAVCLRQWEQFS